MEANFWKFDHPWTFPEVTRDPTKKLDPIGSAVLTFIGQKQKHWHPDRLSNKRQNGLIVRAHDFWLFASFYNYNFTSN